MRNLNSVTVCLQLELKLMGTRQAGTKKAQYPGLCALFLYVTTHKTEKKKKTFYKRSGHGNTTPENTNVYFSQVSSLLFQATCGICG